MEYSQSNSEELEFSNKIENGQENKIDTLESLITAVGEEFSVQELEDALITCVESDVINLEEQSILTALSDGFEKTSEESSDEEDVSISSFEEDYKVYSAPQKEEKQRITYDKDGNILEFDMIFDERKITVVDSNECLNRLQDCSLEPVYFKPQYYLDIPRPKTYSIEDLFGIPHQSELSSVFSSESNSSTDVTTADLGPPLGYQFDN